MEDEPETQVEREERYRLGAAIIDAVLGPLLCADMPPNVQQAFDRLRAFTEMGRVAERR